jgi:hypothetical protein
MNDKAKELTAKKIVFAIKHMPCDKTICMTWKEDHVKQIQENTTARNIMMRDLKKKGIVQSRIGD